MQLRWRIQPMQRERLLQPFRQAACRTGVYLPEFPQNSLQGFLGRGIVRLVVGLGQFAVLVCGFLIGKVPAHVPPLVDLTPLHQAAITAVSSQGRAKGPATVEHGQHGLLEIQAPLGQIGQKSITHSLILAGALVQSQDHFAPRPVDA